MQSVSASLLITKLHLESIGCQLLNDSADLTGDKPQLRHVAYKRHGIQKVNRSK